MDLLDLAFDRLKSLSLEQYRLLSNLKVEIERLELRASHIRGFLGDAEQKQAADEPACKWLRRLKQISFDAEDILDVVATDAELRRQSHPDDDGGDDIGGARGEVRSGIICCFDFMGKVRDSVVCCFGLLWRVPSDLWSDLVIAHQIKEITLKLDDLYEQKQKLGLQIIDVGSQDRCRPSRRPTSSLLAEDIIGRDGEMKEMVNLLLKPEDKVRVLAIFGMGGIGKTTLAKRMFNHPRVEEHFQSRIWVCVSEDFDQKRITEEITAASLSSEERKELSDIPNWDLHQRRFRDKMGDKRFLLVLDDVWEDDHTKWETVCEPLIHGANGSKIIVTTRKKTTAKMVKGTHFPLKVMSDEDMWRILRRYAFDDSEPSEMKQLEIVGKQIVSKLKGLPLAAKIIGRLLNEKLDMERWTEVLGSHTLSQQQNSDDDILPILKLSYDHLSVRLKKCFAYCSLFPKDDILVKRELVSMWMAQNFIPNTTDRPRESVDDLFNKSLIEQSTHERAHNYCLDNKLYKWNIRPEELVELASELFLMHDLVHDVAESVSEDDCFRLGDDAQRKQMNERVRHVSVATTHFDLSKLKNIWEHENLRTLVFLRPSPFELKLHILDDLFSRLKRLRVLGLRGCNIFEGLPSSIGELKHLRFLDLSNTLIRHLPESICRLHNLQVLKLKGCRLLSALPRNTGALVNLRHLELDREIASDVPGLRKLTALQELIVTGSKVGELADMNMLRELRLRNLAEISSGEEANHARLQAKEHLELLELNWGYLFKQDGMLLMEEVADAMRPVNRIRRLLVREYRAVRSPKWMVDPSWVSTSFLESVELQGCEKWEVLPPLGQLPCLKFLFINYMSGVRRIGPEFVNYYEDGRGGGRSSECFPSLEVLRFYYMHELEEWEWAVNVDEGDGGVGEQRLDISFLPRLRTLDIQFCEKLRELPPLPPTLTLLTLVNMGVSELPRWMRRSGGDGNSNADAAAPSTSASSSSSPSLFILRIYDCPNITSLDSGFLQHPLPALKYLFIQYCKELATLPHGLFRHLPSLENLSITDCPKLSWLPSTTEQETALPPSLKRMSVHGCAASIGEKLLLLGNLQRLTSLSTLEVEVSSSETVARFEALSSVRVLAIYEGAGGHVDHTALSKCFEGLSSLKSLSIYNCSAITTLSSSEKASLRGLTRLSITDCGELRSLGGFCPAFVSLKYLRIKGCSKLLHLIEEEAPSSPAIGAPTPRKITVKALRVNSSSTEQIANWLRQIASLEELQICDCPLLKGFADDNGELENALLEQAPSLRQLIVSECENLTSLPSGLRRLSSLETLEVSSCPKIERLPSAGLAHSLKELTMSGCSEVLKERCRKEGDPDWALLSRIPRVDIC